MIKAVAYIRNDERYLQRIEIDNLKHIVEGIRYNQPVSKIENTLIYA